MPLPNKNNFIIPEKSSQLTWQLIRLALPLIGVLLIAVGCGFFSTELISLLGIEVLAASAIAWILQGFLLNTGRSILKSMSILINRSLGAKDHLAIGVYLQQGWLLSLFIAMPIMLIYWQIAPILKFFSQPVIVIPIIQSYFHIAIFSIIPYLLVACNQQVANSLRCNSFVLFSTVVSAGVLIISAYLLVLGKWGAPVMCVTGLAYAVILQNVCALLLTTGYFYFHGKFKEFALFTPRQSRHLSKLKQILSLGWPISLQMATEMLALLCVAVFAGWLNLSSLAAYQVIDQYTFLLLMPIWGLTQAAGLLAGQAYGQQKFRLIKKIAKLTTAISLSFSVMVGILLWCKPQYLASFFIDLTDPSEAVVLALVLKLFFLLIFLILISALNNTLIGLLRALFDTQYPLVLSTLSILGIGLPLGYLLAFNFNMGLFGLYVGYAIGMGLNSTLMLIRWNFKVRQLPVVDLDFPVSQNGRLSLNEK